MKFKTGNDFVKGDVVLVDTLVTAKKYGKNRMTKPFRKDRIYYIISGERGDFSYAVADITYKEYKDGNEDFYYDYLNKRDIRHITKKDIIALAEIMRNRIKNKTEN